jgi:hypothetical protein
MLEKNDARLNSLETTIKLLQDAFGDPDRSTSATQKLEQLQQGRKPVSTYASEFRLISSDLEWNDAALLYWFQKGLNQDVKNLLLNKSKPTSLEIAIHDAIEVDNRLFDSKRNASYSSRVLPSTSTAPSVPAASSHDPMIIDAAINHSRQRGPLSPEEKQKRISNNLCLYCGMPAHIAANCPLLAARNRNFVNQHE